MIRSGQNGRTFKAFVDNATIKKRRLSDDYYQVNQRLPALRKDVRSRKENSTVLLK
jgi:hypothetical protein